MRKSLLAAVAVFALGSSAAFADSLTVGNATHAPVFAVGTGHTTLVSDVGTATHAPVFAVTSGNTSLIAQTGTASRAPVFALDRATPASMAAVNDGRANF